MSNTVFANGGSGVVVRRPYYPVGVKKNVLSGNAGWGLAVEPGTVVELGCNDWFENGLGSISGVAEDSTDLSVDPVFCAVDSADVTLDWVSPLVDAAGCGQIGALGVGCGVTATVVQRFTAERVSGGIRLDWEVGAVGTASEIWLERSDASIGQGWIRPITERWSDNLAVVELDRSAASDRAYWYRLVALEGNDATVIGAPIVVESQANLDSRLVEVGPNPGGGPLRITFVLKYAAAIQVDIFDLQGRRIASPVGGVWPAGMHEVAWDGRVRNGQPAPSGMYVLRYLHPGGQDRRGIMRIP